MDTVTIISAGVLCYVLSLIAVYLITTRRADQKIDEFKSLKCAIKSLGEQKTQAERVLAGVVDRLNLAKENYRKVDTDTKDLQALRDNSKSLAAKLENDKAALSEINSLLQDRKLDVEEKESELHGIMAKIDLYSRVDEFVEYGHFEMPDYLFETGERFAAEIKILRDKQKAMIKNGGAIVQEGELSLTGDAKLDKKIIDGQMKLIIRAFNIECDMLMGKVSPSNFDRTLGRIEKLANDLEKLVASLRCGISIDYVTSKYEECGIQYQYTLKKKDEQEEQRLIREQMREEAKAAKEYEEALVAAEREEKLYRDLLEKARKQLDAATAEERVLAEAKIAELERQLAEAEAKEQRAKSLAEQTRQGHVYVISNIGSFGEHVYKIGMTRRLDPMERVKELGDASVPFAFDVHAIIFAEDAPAMEAELHRKFRHDRVYAVNPRKEFFRVELTMTREAVEEIGGEDVDFRMTILAAEYFETKRLKERTAA